MLTIAANSDRWLCEWYFRNLLFVCFFTVITGIMINVILVLMVLLITATSFTVITVWGEVRRMLLFNTGISNSNTVTSSTGFTWRNTESLSPELLPDFSTRVSLLFFFLFFYTIFSILFDILQNFTVFLLYYLFCTVVTLSLNLLLLLLFFFF